MNANKTESGDGKIPNKENREYAIHGAKLYCSFCTIPTGDLIVTSHNVMMQGKYTATTADCIPMTNIIFKGQCTVAPGLVPPPCSAVIRLGKWMNFAPTVEVFGNKALLTESVIPCLMGGSQIRIVDSGQMKMKIIREKDPRVTSLYWMDEEEEKRIKEIKAGQTVTFVAETRDYEYGETLDFNLENHDTGEMITLSGEVGDYGTVKIKWTNEKKESEANGDNI